MTVTTTDTVVTLVTAPETSAYPFAYAVRAAADVEVYHTPTGGTETQLTVDVDYSIALNANNLGGTITTLSALAAGEMRIQRNTSLLQNANLQTAQRPDMEAIEGGLDVDAMRAQEHRAEVKRGLRAPAGETGTDLTLPSAASRAGLTLIFDATGNPAAGASLGVALVGMPEDGQGIVYDLANGYFIPGTVGGGGGSGTVDTTGTPEAAQFARWTDENTLEGISVAAARTALNVADGADATAGALQAAGSITAASSDLVPLLDASASSALGRDTVADVVAAGLTAVGSISPSTSDRIVLLDASGSFAPGYGTVESVLALASSGGGTVKLAAYGSGSFNSGGSNVDVPAFTTNHFVDSDVTVSGNDFTLPPGDWVIRVNFSFADASTSISLS
ncbi:MAG: hypothetical protein AAFR28_19130, partial [Pseudomonadota bacterium]